MGLLVAVFHTLLRLCRAPLANAANKREPQDRGEAVGEVGDESWVPQRGNARDPLGRGLGLPVFFYHFGRGMHQASRETTIRLPAPAHQLSPTVIAPEAQRPAFFGAYLLGDVAFPPEA